MLMTCAPWSTAYLMPLATASLVRLTWSGWRPSTPVSRTATVPPAPLDHPHAWGTCSADSDHSRLRIRSAFAARVTDAADVAGGAGAASAAVAAAAAGIAGMINERESAATVGRRRWVRSGRRRPAADTAPNLLSGLSPRSIKDAHFRRRDRTKRSRTVGNKLSPAGDVACHSAEAHLSCAASLCHGAGRPLLLSAHIVEITVH